MFTAMILSVLATLGGASAAQTEPEPTAASTVDPTATDGDKYHVILENDSIRVLRYHDEPGAETHLHHHPKFLLYALGAFRRKLIAADGSSRIREFKAGDVVFLESQSHRGVNIGTTPTDVLIVEFKAL
jgi:beta-alanine degradation protein BauB